MAELKAVFFDQDGVIIDTERDGHRVAFNEAFRQAGIPLEWSVEGYHDLLQVGGGKERMRQAFREQGLFADLDDTAFDEKIRECHHRKTDIFIEMLRDGGLPLRSGIRRMMEQLNDAGLVLAITTTSNERTAELISNRLLRGIRFDFIIAGDMIQRKKPDAEIYLKAIDQAGIHPEEGLVFEDSHIGVTAAKAAGLNVVATINDYTAGEDLSAADIVLSCLGDREDKTEVIGSRRPFSCGNSGVLWPQLRAYFKE